MPMEHHHRFVPCLRYAASYSSGPAVDVRIRQVAHRELQFEVRDHRLVPDKPVQRFGYLTPQLHGRFMKGEYTRPRFFC